ncbi:hypothetical protein [Nostoc sp. CHAB 5715]|uniref:hypothetical protein n=1 Tax=Nostoc sp. CHAB 5715 TaxID=2780400 RepID=UPI001E346A12|nr:hypothetical protein [Nostoc sp. CHAB 5715]MCC5621807.1 hypothetical protein [Nostoc sp. CHAB 5715]
MILNNSQYFGYALRLRSGQAQYKFAITFCDSVHGAFRREALERNERLKQAEVSQALTFDQHFVQAGFQALMR